MTLANTLRDILSGPNGRQAVNQFIKDAMNDPSTRHEIAEARDFRSLPQTNEKHTTSE